MLGLGGLRANVLKGASPVTFQVRSNHTESIMSKLMSKESNQSTLKTPEPLRTYRRESKRLLNATDVKMNPKDVAKHIPITGPIAGRMVAVNPGNIDGAFRNLKFLVNSNNVKTDKNAQRFYKKPGKVLEEKAIRRKKKLFDAGVRRLIDIVKEAKRRGY